MFGVGPQEVVIIVLLLLVVFGPGKAANMARDLGRFVSEARWQVEEFKDDLLGDDEDDGEELSGGSSDNNLKNAEGEVHKQVEGRELDLEEEALPSEMPVQE